LKLRTVPAACRISSYVAVHDEEQRLARMHAQLVTLLQAINRPDMVPKANALVRKFETEERLNEELRKLIDGYDLTKLPMFPYKKPLEEFYETNVPEKPEKVDQVDGILAAHQDVTELNKLLNEKYGKDLTSTASYARVSANEQTLSRLHAKLILFYNQINKTKEVPGAKALVRTVGTEDKLNKMLQKKFKNACCEKNWFGWRKSCDITCDLTILPHHELREPLLKFYDEFNTDMMKAVDGVLAAYPDEEKLNTLLKAKYGVDLNSTEEEKKHAKEKNDLNVEELRERLTRYCHAETSTQEELMVEILAEMPQKELNWLLEDKLGKDSVEP